MDVTDEASIARALAGTEAALGPVEVLVANAGITGPNHLLEDYPVEAWRRVIEVDLVGVLSLLPGGGAGDAGAEPRADRQHRQHRRQGGQSECLGLLGGEGGVIGLTKSLGKELAETGVRVNCITPAAVETELFRQMTAEQVAWMKSKIPMGRFGLPEEVAEMAAFLASDAVSFSTGAVFDCSGGRATY
jgi:NAD(P)-dependent dehydrogenase (short-subunit alcohol dehydrogenase family)